jgi:hypothetical protein
MMTPREFKAWFEGFTEAFSGVPTKAQWARIKERVSEIDGQPITERVFIDRWWPHYSSTWPAQQTFHIASAMPHSVCNTTCTTFNGTSAMYAVGQLDALTLGAPAQ